jgi:methyl-accepting chemotaxis protein
VSKIIEEIASASSEQAESIQLVSNGLTEISDVTQSNSAASEETASASTELASLADSLIQLFKEQNND